MDSPQYRKQEKVKFVLGTRPVPWGSGEQQRRGAQQSPSDDGHLQENKTIP